MGVFLDYKCLNYTDNRERLDRHCVLWSEASTQTQAGVHICSNWRWNCCINLTSRHTLNKGTMGEVYTRPDMPLCIWMEMKDGKWARMNRYKTKLQYQGGVQKHFLSLNQYQQMLCKGATAQPSTGSGLLPGHTHIRTLAPSASVTIHTYTHHQFSHQWTAALHSWTRPTQAWNRTLSMYKRECRFANSTLLICLLYITL